MCATLLLLLLTVLYVAYADILMQSAGAVALIGTVLVPLGL